MTAKQRDQLRLSAAALAFFACAMWLALSTLNPRAVARQAPIPQAALLDVAILLLPAELAVAGLTPAQAQVIVQRVAMEQAQTVATLRQSREQSDSYAAALSAAQEVLFRGGATAERLAARDAAQSGLDTAAASHRAAREQICAAAYEAIRDAVGPENAAIGRRWSANAFRKVPEALKALDLSDEAWRLLESAWRRTQRGEELSPAQATALASAQASTVASLTNQRLTSNLGAMSDLVVQFVADSTQGN